MGLIKIKKGLDIPITGAPVQIIGEGNTPNRVALLGDDYPGMKPTMAVQVGEAVKLGQVLFTDKKTPRVQFTSPAAGKVIEINRGEKRHFISVVIEIQGQEEIPFAAYSASQLESLSADMVIQQLLDSGLWTALRSRPFSRVANPDARPHSIFITAMDSQPLAPAVDKIIEGHKDNFLTGLRILSRLTDGKLYLCKYPDSSIPTAEIDKLSVEEFSGPHPAGLAGTHIHFLDPVDRHKTVWQIGAQDVAAIGLLFTTGKLNVERVISLAGPVVKNPRLIRTRLGASLESVTAGELREGKNRVISGSVLSGFTASGATAYLGRYHQQVSVIREGGQRQLLGWAGLGFQLFSVKRVLASSLTPRRKFAFTTALHGGHRSIVPIGSYEKVVPLDILATYLLRALAVNDVEDAENLGCLELDEEDLALCTFVCPSKIDHGSNLRQTFNLIMKEG